MNSFECECCLRHKMDAQELRDILMRRDVELMDLKDRISFLCSMPLLPEETHKRLTRRLVVLEEAMRKLLMKAKLDYRPGIATIKAEEVMVIAEEALKK